MTCLSPWPRRAVTAACAALLLGSHPELAHAQAEPRFFLGLT